MENECNAQALPLLSYPESYVETKADEIDSINGEKFHEEDRAISHGTISVRRVPWLTIALYVGVIAAIAAIPATILYTRTSKAQESTEISSSCQNPSIRREWRTLSTTEKLAYLDAVVCLTKTPSIVGRNQTLFDDFPWLHNNVGKSAHRAAPFLAWHRYFLHIYEAQLRNHCNYTGSLVFFDWQLNVHDLAKAPIWDSTTGFGGDGNPSEPKTVNDARCVTDGPFANLSVLYYGDESKPHCLSRGLQQPADMAKYFSARVSKDAIAELMATPRYEDFNLNMEHGPHLAMPHAVLGDFLVDTAPNDPVFFLHHAQLDRLWWKWQHAKPGRLREYNGESSHRSGKEASLQDQLEMGVLAPAAEVGSVIDARSGILCYSYAY